MVHTARRSLCLVMPAIRCSKKANPHVLLRRLGKHADFSMAGALDFGGSLPELVVAAKAPPLALPTFVSYQEASFDTASPEKDQSPRVCIHSTCRHHRANAAALMALLD